MTLYRLLASAPKFASIWLQPLIIYSGLGDALPANREVLPAPDRLIGDDRLRGWSRGYGAPSPCRSRSRSDRARPSWPF